MDQELVFGHRHQLNGTKHCQQLDGTNKYVQTNVHDVDCSMDTFAEHLELSASDVDEEIIMLGCASAPGTIIHLKGTREKEINLQEKENGIDNACFNTSKVSSH